LRALAGVKGKVSVSTPSKARVIQPKTPASSAKKRKMKEDTESDADGHFTPEEQTPTAQRKSAQRGGANRGRSTFGNRTGNGNGDDRVHIKTGTQPLRLIGINLANTLQRCPTMPASPSSLLVPVSSALP
jgi:hypothetical protein